MHFNNGIYFEHIFFVTILFVIFIRTSANITTYTYNIYEEINYNFDLANNISHLSSIFQLERNKIFHTNIFDKITIQLYNLFIHLLMVLDRFSILILTCTGRSQLYQYGRNPVVADNTC